MEKLKHYEDYNQRRYSSPWVAKVNIDTLKIDFTEDIGGYTGDRHKGEEGDLYITNPAENQIYAYGQKDYKGKQGGYSYVVYKNGEFEEIDKSNLIDIANEIKNKGEQK